MTDKIQLYQLRNFSEKFSATFDFLRQNWRLFLRLSLYLLLPLSIIQGIFTNSYYSTVMKDVFTASASNYDDMPWGALIILMVVSVLNTLMLVSLTFTIIKKYEQSNSDISTLTLHDLWPSIKKNLGKTLLVMIAYIVIYSAIVTFLSFAIGFSIALSTIGLSVLLILVLIAGVVAVFPPLTLLMPIYMLEDDAKLWDSIKKSFVYGFKTWGGLFALLFVIGIIVSTISYFVMVPGLVLAALKSTLFPATFTGVGILPLIYTIVQDALIIVGQYVANMLLAIPLIAVTFHYGHAAEVIDNVSVADEIDHFDQLADNGEDADDDATKLDIPEIPMADNTQNRKADDIDNFNNL